MKFHRLHLCFFSMQMTFSRIVRSRTGMNLILLMFLTILMHLMYLTTQVDGRKGLFLNVNNHSAIFRFAGYPAVPYRRENHEKIFSKIDCYVLWNCKFIRDQFDYFHSFHATRIKISKYIRADPALSYARQKSIF